MSKQVRSLVLKRHVATMLIYIICNLYIFMTYFAILVPAWNANIMNYDSWFFNMAKILFASQGWFIPLMRLSEPFFYQILT